MIKVGLLLATEAWIIDRTGCQYGFREILVPFDKYVTDEACQLLGDPTIYNATEMKDLDYFSTLPFINKLRAQRKSRGLERK